MTTLLREEDDVLDKLRGAVAHGSTDDDVSIVADMRMIFAAVPARRARRSTSSSRSVSTLRSCTSSTTIWLAPVSSGSLSS